MSTTETREDSIKRRSVPLNEINEELYGDILGIAQAIGSLRKQLDLAEKLLNNRSLEELPVLGYKGLASEFIFLQRVLGGLQGSLIKFQKLAQEVAYENKCAYEDVEPHIIELLSAFKPINEEL